MTIQKQPMLRLLPVSLLLLFWLFPSTSATLSASWWGFLPLFFCFALFSASILALGARIERQLGGKWAGVFLYSSLLLCAVAMLLGQLGLLHSTFLFAGVSVFGAWHYPELKAKRLWGFLETESKRVLLCLFVLFGFAFFVRAFSAFLPQAHGDPLLYHLVGPKLWMDMGKAKLHPDLPIALLSSSWEYLYVWPQAIWRGVDGLPRLVAAQIFSQWMHLFWGWIGCAAVLFQLVREQEKRFAHAALVVCAALFVANVQWPAALAKNDTGVAFWAFGALLFLRMTLRSGDLSGFLLAGIFAGLAVIGKLNAGLVLAAGFFLLFSDLRSAWKTKEKSFFLNGFFLGAIGSVAAMLPVLWRNFVETGNSLYPLFPHLFPSPWVTQSWAHHFSSVHPKDSFNRVDHLFYRLSQLPAESPFLVGWLLLPFFLISKSGRAFLRLLAPWILFAIAVLFLFVVGFNGEAELRYLGGGLMAMALVGALVWLRVLELLPLSDVWKKRLPLIVVAIALLASSKLPTHLLWKARKIAPGVAFLETHTAGDSKEWIRQNVEKSTLVIMVADNESYYLTEQHVTILTERPDLDGATFGVKEFPAFLRGICSVSKARYLLDARPAVGLLSRFPELTRYDAVAFQGKASTIYDLAKLDRIVSRGQPYGCASDESK